MRQKTSKNDTAASSAPLMGGKTALFLGWAAFCFLWWAGYALIDGIQRITHDAKMRDEAKLAAGKRAPVRPALIPLSRTPAALKRK